MTQCERIVDYLDSHVGITSKEAMEKLGVYRLASRIHDLKESGYEFERMGELYLAENGSSWAKKYETKYPAGRPLHYGYPGTGDHCFETAKETHKEEWTNIVRREVGKG